MIVYVENTTASNKMTYGTNNWIIYLGENGYVFVCLQCSWFMFCGNIFVVVSTFFLTLKNRGKKGFVDIGNGRRDFGYSSFLFTLTFGTSFNIWKMSLYSKSLIIYIGQKNHYIYSLPCHLIQFSSTRWIQTRFWYKTIEQSSREWLLSSWH